MLYGKFISQLKTLAYTLGGMFAIIVCYSFQFLYRLGNRKTTPFTQSTVFC